MNIKGGTVSAEKGNAICLMGAKVNISGGAVQSTDSEANATIYMGMMGYVNVSGGKILNHSTVGNGCIQFVSQMMGELSITGGELTSDYGSF